MILTGFSGLVAAVGDPSGDPLSVFTSLGVAGLVAVTMFLWQRDTAKQRDAAMKLSADFAEGLRELKNAVDNSTKAHEAATKAQEKMTDVMEDLPSKDVWLRIAVALESSKRA